MRLWNAARVCDRERWRGGRRCRRRGSVREFDLELVLTRKNGCGKETTMREECVNLQNFEVPTKQKTPRWKVTRCSLAKKTVLPRKTWCAFRISRGGELQPVSDGRRAGPNYMARPDASPQPRGAQAGAKRSQVSSSLTGTSRLTHL